MSLKISSPEGGKFTIQSDEYLSALLTITLNDFANETTYYEWMEGFEHTVTLSELISGKTYSLEVAVPDLNKEIKGEFVCGSDAVLEAYQLSIMAALRSWLLAKTAERSIFLVEIEDTFLSKNPVKFTLIEPIGGEVLFSKKHSLRQNFSLKAYGKTRIESSLLDSVITNWLREMRNYRLLNSRTIIKSVTFSSAMPMVDEAGWYYTMRELRVFTNVLFERGT